MLKRLPGDQLEEESLNALATFFNSRSWEFNRQVRDKSGIDGEVEIIHGIERTGRSLKCQVKAGLSYVSSETEAHIRLRVERKYLEHWERMTAPVLLFFYHPTTRTFFWKAIKEYLDQYPNLLKHGTETCGIIFDKEQDKLTPESLAAMEQVEARKFSYSHILIEGSLAELGWSNWFQVKRFPPLLQAPCRVSSRSEISPYVDREYSYVVHDSRLIALSNIRNTECELRKFIDTAGVRPMLQGDIPSNIFVELLNNTLLILTRQLDLVHQGDRFFFSSGVLKSEETKTFSYVSLKGLPETRQKVYVRRFGSRTENIHHAVRLSFLRHLGDWLLVVEPDWYLSYPFGGQPSRREVGARVTSLKASTYNKDYLYLIHFWRQFLSNNTDTISIPCSFPGDGALIEVRSLPVEFGLRFRFFNDYDGPKDNVP